MTDAPSLPAIDITVTVEDNAWSQALTDAAARAEAAVEAAINAARADTTAGAPLPKTAVAYEMGVVLTDDARIRKLNNEWRDQDKPTNVLAFESPDEPPEGAPWQLGDVIVAFGTTAGEAEAAGLTLADHLVHLVVHGVLHLFGYDHILDEDAEEMEVLETQVLAGMGVADPYESAGHRA
jgi:probable rRNA maturation factor